MADIDLIVPRWAESWVALAHSNALVRSQCRRCGIQQRVDAAVQMLRYGATASPLGHSERCMIVGCHGEAFILIARTYGRQWLPMMGRSDTGHQAPAANAVSLDLVKEVSPSVNKGR